MSSAESTPQSSRPASSRGTRSPLSLDLSSVPPLTQPTPPSNTLLITNLQDTEIFRADNLQTIKELINASAPIWEMKLEDAPNKLVHAEDLAEALAKLHHKPKTDLPASPLSDEEEGSGKGRQRSGSSATTIYDPGEHGHSPNLPAIAVEDLTGENEVGPIEAEKPILAHTARPPVELMDQ